MVEAVLHLDVQAPAAARALAADFLRNRVTPRLVDIAQLIMSELVSNSLRHNAAPHGQAVVVRVALERGTWRLEVEDPGGGGVLAPTGASRRRPPRDEPRSRASASAGASSTPPSAGRGRGPSCRARRWGRTTTATGLGSRRSAERGQRPSACSTTPATSSGREKNGECDARTRRTVLARAAIASCTGGGTARSSSQMR